MMDAPMSMEDMSDEEREAYWDAEAIMRAEIVRSKMNSDKDYQQRVRKALLSIGKRAAEDAKAQQAAAKMAQKMGAE